MHDDQQEETPERGIGIWLAGRQSLYRRGRFDHSQSQKCQPPYKMTKSQEPLRREMPVGILIAKKHPHYCRDGKSVQNERLLRKQKPQFVRNELCQRLGWLRGG